MNPKMNTDQYLSALKSIVADYFLCDSWHSKLSSIFYHLEKVDFFKTITAITLAKISADHKSLTYVYWKGFEKDLPLSDFKYYLNEQSLITEAYKRNRILIIDQRPFMSTKRDSIYRRSLNNVETSVFAMPVMKQPDNILGVLGLTSPERNLFSRETASFVLPVMPLIAECLLEIGSIDEIIPTLQRFREGNILLLSKDNGPELQRLHDIRSFLEKLKYNTVLVKEHPDIPELSNEDKVRIISGFCKFVLMENTFPAGQIAECKICSTNRIVTASLREVGTGSSYMVTDYFKDFDFMEEFEYELAGLESVVRQAVQWGENKVDERMQYFNKIYPWRNNVS